MYTGEEKSKLDELSERAVDYIIDAGDHATREGLITHLVDEYNWCCREVAEELADKFLPDSEEY